jgi:hypothetical protein
MRVGFILADGLGWEGIRNDRGNYAAHADLSLLGLVAVGAALMLPLAYAFARFFHPRALSLMAYEAVLAAGALIGGLALSQG